MPFEHDGVTAGPATRPDLGEVPGVTADAWLERYREYIERSAVRAARAQELNREVMRRIASGELSSWTLEAQLATFVATRAAEYSQRTASMTMAFLSGLIQNGSTYSYELVEAVIPGAAIGRVAVAPEFEPSNPAEWFRELTQFAAQENERVTAMLRTVMDRVASGELAPAEVEDISSRFQAERVPESTSRLVALYLDLLGGLDEVHGAFGEDYLRSVLVPFLGEPQTPGEAQASGARPSSTCASGRRRRYAWRSPTPKRSRCRCVAC